MARQSVRTLFRPSVPLTVRPPARSYIHPSIYPFEQLIKNFTLHLGQITVILAIVILDN